MAANANARTRASDARFEFVIARLIEAPRALVFKAWTDPQQLARWWGPKDVTTPVCEIDLRPGGAHRIVTRSSEGVLYPIKGVFREIVAPERLVMTLDCSEHPPEWHDMVKPGRRKSDTNPAGEMLQTVTSDDRGDRTLLTIRTRFTTAAIRDAMLAIGMTEGWAQSLDRLMTLVADTTDREMVISRTIAAPRELVFAAWTDPKHIAQWWGPNGFTSTVHAMDVRPGGVWRLTMHGPDGTDFPNLIEYLEGRRTRAPRLPPWLRRARRPRPVPRDGGLRRRGQQDPAAHARAVRLGRGPDPGGRRVPRDRGRKPDPGTPRCLSCEHVSNFPRAGEST